MTSKPNRLPKAVGYLLLLALALLTIIPFYSMFVMATYNSYEIFKFNGLPSTFALENLRSVLAMKEMGRFFLNSIVVSAASVFIGGGITAACGYGLAKFEFKGRKFLFATILFTMMVPTQLGLVAYVWEMKILGFADTLVPAILPFLSMGFGAFWMTQFIRDAVPNELMESARIDAAGEFRIFASIILPVITPAVYTLSLLLLIWSWNSFLVPLLTLNDTKLYTLPLGITMFNSMYASDNGAKIMALSLATLPVLLVYVLFANKLMDGLTAGAVKG